MAAPSPVPSKSTYWAYMVEWAGYLNTWHANNPGQGLGNVYYDGQMCAYRVRDYTADAAWDAFVQRAWQAYVPEYVLANNGGVQGYRNFTNGPLEDVLRNTSRKAQSLSAVNLIMQNGAYVSAGDVTGQELSRECALALVAHIDYQRAGNTLTAAQLARRGYLLEKALGHVDQWAVSQTAAFFKPFMGAHTARALIEYHERVSPDPRVLPALRALANHTRSSCWKADPGPWGPGQSFLYQDRYLEPGDSDTAPDLNVFICPYFGWLWKMTGEQTFRTWGDEAWLGGLPNYSGAFHVSGSYLGTRSAVNPSGKQYDQQLLWGPRYVEWAEATPVSTGGGTTPPASTPPVTVNPSGTLFEPLRTARRSVVF